MKNRVAILDIYDGYKDRQDPSSDCIDKFRDALGINNLDYAAAYYPWVHTTVVQDNDLGYENISNSKKPDKLLEILRAELKIPKKMQGGPLEEGDMAEARKKAKDEIKETVDKLTKEDKAAIEADDESEFTSNTIEYELLLRELNRLLTDGPKPENKADRRLINNNLITMTPLAKLIQENVKRKLNLLPPSAAMAGVYTMVDNSRGVWKAPANVSLNVVVSPAVNITHDDQEDLNVTTQGKSINAIRPFIGEGTLVWGARTLDGNSLDWRYINVRRTMIMLEESIRLATKAYVFEPNDANTWVTIKSMIRNFLTGIWKRGGLAGMSPDDAFSVQVGLGETMTPEDIPEGFVLGDVEKEYLLTLIQQLSAVYFTDVLGFCLMGNHFHLLVRMLPETAFSDDDIRTRFQRYYGADRERQLTDGQIPTLRAKWASLSDYVKEIKQSFSRWYNKRHGRKGFFWGERFKSVLVDNGDTLVNCLAYIDLNPVRAGLVERPEDYRWCSLAYHVQTGNKDDFLSLDFGLAIFSNGDAKTRLQYYRRYVYENGAQPTMKEVPLDPQLVDKEAKKGFALTPVDRLLYRTRYFTDSGVIGTKAFVSRCSTLFESHFSSRHAKRPRPIAGLPGVYALKRLADTR